MERVRAVVLDDADGTIEALDAAMDKSCAEALKDPWKEAVTPKTANQFADLIPAGEA
jgi:nitrite reductase (NADH) large subunit